MGIAIWMISRATIGYQKQQIGWPVLLFMLALALLVLAWLYGYSRNHFKSVIFTDNALLLADIFGRKTRVEVNEIKAITSLGIKTNGKLLPISLYFMSNNGELYLVLDDWMKNAEVPPHSPFPEQPAKTPN